MHDNINLVNSNFDLITMRIYVAKLLGLNIIQNNKLNTSLINQGSFYVSNDNLKDYIINNVDDYMDPNMKNILDNNERNVIDDGVKLSHLEMYLQDDLTYNFNGILISKNKLFINLDCLQRFDFELNNDVVFNSILYGSILNSYQIEDIKNIIYSKKYTKN